jgi:outer membrane biosynthesis protein TonB
VTVNTGGIDFPYPGYLENIVRQIALRFKPATRGALRAEVFFMINRDGSVPPSSIRLVTRSGVYSFDADAQGAVEAAANAKSFGALPAGFTSDALPVTFRFDPRLLR